MSPEKVQTADSRFVRDPKNMALLAHSKEDYLLYKAKRRQDARLNEVSEDVATLKEQMAEIKSLMLQLVRQTEDA